jgi:alpha-mannosidase
VADIRDRHIMVKNWFIPRLNNVKAYFETPYGVVERSVSGNTSWEWARYEQPFLNWFTLEDDQHGIAFISPVKHGVSINYNRIGLTLFRTPIIPDPLSDSGQIEFSYSILPYKGSWLEANIHGIAYMKTNPIYIPHRIGEGEQESINPLIEEVYPDNIVITAIKPSDDEGLILRLFNYANKYGRLRLKFRKPISKAYRLNILEEMVKSLKIRQGRIIEYMYRPYEIITLKILYT